MINSSMTGNVGTYTIFKKNFFNSKKCRKNGENVGKASYGLSADFEIYWIQ